MATLSFNPGHDYLLEVGFDVTFPFTLDSSELDDGRLGPFEPTPSSWIDVTSKLISANIQRGSTTPEEQPSAGTMDVQLLDQERAYDPLNTLGAHYGSLLPGRFARFSVDGIRLFSGTTGPWSSALASGTQRAAFRATDALAQLSRETLRDEVVLAGTATGTAVDELLTASDWLYGSDVTATSGSVSVTFEVGNNARECVQQVARSEGTALYASRENVLTLRDRLASALASAGTLTPTNSGVRYTDVATSAGDDVFTAITIADTTGAVAIAVDIPLLAQLGTRTLEVATVLADATEAQTLADFLLARWSTSTQLVRQVTVLPSASVTNQATLFALDLQDLVCLRREWSTGAPLAAEDYYSIEAINHTIDSARHDIELQLAPAALLVALVLDDPLLGALSDPDGTVPPSSRPGSPLG